MGLSTLYTRDAPDTVFAGYTAVRVSGYSKSRIPYIRPNTWLDNYIFGKISIKFIIAVLTIIDLSIKQPLNEA
jgi:hypothetical protein